MEKIENVKSSVSAVAEYRQSIDTAQGTLLAMAYDVEVLAQTISDMITFGTNENDDFPATEDNALRQYNEMRDLWDFIPEEVLIDDDPAALYALYVQYGAVINALSLLSIMSFDSYDAAIALRDEVFTKAEEILQHTTDDDLFLAIIDLQTAVETDIETRGATLARLRTIKLPESLPAVVLSYHLYGKVDYAEDIVNRNKVDNPLFVPGGKDIEVLVYE
jgi:hypothetical protein